ncbi:hypothetical protein B0I35DRAFT_447057 [Stachybotrys elegans]|uniref:Secreted protein n=1 Tax=Stachybotrys elegans TaxID=80388 RepID=A0A8K0WKD6_9HYPO|nr:hypothetical protein B0I35DRAFT_447057 [Stachybotrys elegans]
MTVFDFIASFLLGLDCCSHIIHLPYTQFAIRFTKTLAVTTFSTSFAMPAPYHCGHFQTRLLMFRPTCSHSSECRTNCAAWEARRILDAENLPAKDNNCDSKLSNLRVCWHNPDV